MTRRGVSCRNPAVAGSDPPACRHHRRQDDISQPDVPPLYAGGLKEREKVLWEELAGDASLKDELALIRVVLSRLMERLDDPAYVLLPEDLRGLAGLIFTGARTVAQLLTQQAGHSEDVQPWLAQALSTFSTEYEIDL